MRRCGRQGKPFHFGQNRSRHDHILAFTRAFELRAPARLSRSRPQIERPNSRQRRRSSVHSSRTAKVVILRGQSVERDRRQDVDRVLWLAVVPEEDRLEDRRPRHVCAAPAREMARRLRHQLRSFFLPVGDVVTRARDRILCAPAPPHEGGRGPGSFNASDESRFTRGTSHPHRPLRVRRQSASAAGSDASAACRCPPTTARPHSLKTRSSRCVRGAPGDRVYGGPRRGGPLTSLLQRLHAGRGLTRPVASPAQGIGACRPCVQRLIRQVQPLRRARDYRDTPPPGGDPP